VSNSVSVDGADAISRIDWVIRLLWTRMIVPSGVLSMVVPFSLKEVAMPVEEGTNADTKAADDLQRAIDNETASKDIMRVMCVVALISRIDIFFQCLE